MAAANSAEQRHQQVSRPASPLREVRYDHERGEYDHFRFVESANDDLVAAVTLGALELRGPELVELRDALTQDDLYTLLAFASRVAVRVLRGQADQLLAGCAAVGLVDSERVDWRDAAGAICLLSYSASRTGADAPTALDRALAIAQPGMARLIREYGTSAEVGLSDFHYREVATAAGPALTRDDGKPFHPTLDLLSVAGALTQVVEADEYRVRQITTGTDISSAWLPSADPRAVEKARKRIRAGLRISAVPHGATSPFPPQSLSVYLAECTSLDDAELLTRASRHPGIASLAVSLGRLCAIVVARSNRQGLETTESSDGLERLRGPIAEALSVD
ncbi:MAG TPA: hypothetical protein VFY88_03230 [Intrasporangium sp.]|nr:hypothetical protein [Intrasporangium sp.]